MCTWCGICCLNSTRIVQNDSVAAHSLFLSRLERLWAAALSPQQQQQQQQLDVDGHVFCLGDMAPGTIEVPSLCCAVLVMLLTACLTCAVFD